MRRPAYLFWPPGDLTTTVPPGVAHSARAGSLRNAAVFFRQSSSIDPVTSRLQRRCTAAPAIFILTALALLAARLPAQSTTSASHDYTQADVDFVQGMILHHAQAVVISDWATTHDAQPSLQTLCKRIALSQRDEISVMQRWLRERRLSVPDPLHMLPGSHGSAHDTSGISMPGMAMGNHSMGMDLGDHPKMMAGMLTPDELHRLDAARGSAFDRLYLTGMIKHHQGALDMVAKLFATPAGGQQSEIFALATDVDAGQRAEIARMESMLNTLTKNQTR